MAATTQELIKKGFSIYFKGLSPTFKQKIEIIAHHFGSINSFLCATKEDFENITFIGGEKAIKLTETDFEKIQNFQQSGLLDSKLSIQENFVKILVSEFVNRQLQMIESLELETLNINPNLAGALNLNNEKDLIRYYVYQAISRSIVTSVGFLVQNLILYASEYVHEGKDEIQGEQTKWDIVVDKINEVKAYLEIKSGINDVKVYFDDKEILKQINLNDYFIENCILYDGLLNNPKNLKLYTEFVNLFLNQFVKNIEKNSKTLYLILDKKNAYKRTNYRTQK